MRNSRCGKTRLAWLLLLWVGISGISVASVDGAELSAEELTTWKRLLSQPVLEPGTTLLQVQNFCESRVPHMPEVTSRAAWEQTAAQLRERALQEVVLRGAAAEWAQAATQVEWFDVIEPAPEYRIRKLRFEAVPGMVIPALLYEPTQIEGRIPVMLCVNGHDSQGTAADYKQIRCINLAKRGMLVLNLEWVGMGQLRGPDFDHYRMNQLDLCGTSGLAPFYLSMKRGLDVLLSHEQADPTRVAVSGLSGGGWQTIFISGLDERVTLANPVAGYSSFRTRARVTADLGDSEQTPSDLATVLDYTHLTAMRAPRPTLLTNNDRDHCCFTAGNALPLLLEAARPVYRLYDEADNLWVHINHLPGSHNYEQDNREALYRMLGAHFYAGSRSFPTEELPCEGEVLKASQLAVPMPDKNAGFNTLAREMAATLSAKRSEQETPKAASEKDSLRLRLAKTIRLQDMIVTSAASQDLGKVGEVALTGVALQIGPEWTVPAVLARPPQSDRVALLICDGGRVGAAEQIASLAARGMTVVAVDPFYFGESRIPQRDFLYGLLVAAVGERPVGIQVSQLRAVLDYIVEHHPNQPIEVHSVGRRLGLAATILAAIEHERVVSLTRTGTYRSLQEVIAEGTAVNEAPELFCFGLLQQCDIPMMEALIAPRPITNHSLPTAPQRR